LYLKKILIILVLFFGSLHFACADETIRAENNAYRHNNMGLMYLNENYYFGAIKEFQIAIDLLPDKQASAAFYVNLGKTYEKIGYDNLAQKCFEKAVSLNILCFDYYLVLAENYQKQGLSDEKILEFQRKTPSPLNDIMIGLLYIQKGQLSTGMTVLDEFCNKEPNLIITFGVRQYLDNITKKIL
jgi:tetratricopeptide (TPR) repeat protein